MDEDNEKSNDNMNLEYEHESANVICRQHGDEVKGEEEEIDPLDAYLQTIDTEVQTFEEKYNVDHLFIIDGIGEQKRERGSDGGGGY